MSRPSIANFNQRLNETISWHSFMQRALNDYMALREAAIKLGCVTLEEFDALVKPEDMTHP